jgi:hypothetical protein
MTDDAKDTPTRTRPDGSTRDAERRDAQASHDAPQRPSTEEDAAAERAERDPQAEESYREYLRTAARSEGEGRIP